MQQSCKINETLANRYSSESTQQKLSKEYKHDRVYMLLKSLCVHVLWTKLVSALERFMLMKCHLQSEMMLLMAKKVSQS